MRNTNTDTESPTPPPPRICHCHIVPFPVDRFHHHKRFNDSAIISRKQQQQKKVIKGYDIRPIQQSTMPFSRVIPWDNKYNRRDSTFVFPLQ